jgi:hypothetical protein
LLKRRIHRGRSLAQSPWGHRLKGDKNRGLRGNSPAF